MDVFTGYGMSETCPILTIAHVRDELPDADAQAAERIKTGYTIPLVDLHTVDAEMLDAERDGKATGEIVVRAPWLTQGYLHNPEASEDLWAGSYLHTGDIGTLDPRGMLTVTDRLKDVIKTGGEWVSSLELESIISQHPAVNKSRSSASRTTSGASARWRWSSCAGTRQRSTTSSSTSCALPRKATSRSSRCPSRFVLSTAWPAPASASSTRRPCASNWPDNAIQEISNETSGQ
jgi:hypothetical protein